MGTGGSDRIRRTVRLFVPIISANTERAGEGYVFREWTEAVDRSRSILGRRFIVPVVIDDDYDGDPSRYKQIPADFRRLHFGRAPAGTRMRAARMLTAEIRDMRRTGRGMIQRNDTTQLDRENPWPGLESFEENGNDFFFGRGHEAANAAEQGARRPGHGLVWPVRPGQDVAAASGTVSLAARATNFLPVYVRFELKPGAAPLTRQLHQSVHDRFGPTLPDAMLPSDEESLWEYLHRADFELWSARNYPLTPVIVLDQFEELFTLGERVPDLVDDSETTLVTWPRTAFLPSWPRGSRRRGGGGAISFAVAQLQVIDQPPGRLSSRPRRMAPAYSRAGTLADAAASLAGSRRTRCGTQTGRGPDDAMRWRAGWWASSPARTCTAAATPQGPTSIARDDPGASDVEPALLSLFCRELNEERKRRGQPQFDEQLVEDAKRDILSNYYASCVGDLPPRVAEFIESELITEKGFRNIYAREDAVPSRLTEDELAQLISSRLLRLEDHYGAQRIELTHDVLTGVYANTATGGAQKRRRKTKKRHWRQPRNGNGKPQAA